MNVKAAVLLSGLILLVSYAYSQAGFGIGFEIIDSSGPIVYLLGPVNNSVKSAMPVVFYYNATDAGNVDNCSLIINQTANATSISITKNALSNFTVSGIGSGYYRWRINCTDSSGNRGQSAFRNVIVSLSSPTSGYNGTTTNLSNVDITNVTNFTIESTSYGKLLFLENVDLSGSLDFGQYINLSFNRIEIDSNSLPALNKSALLSFYGLTFNNPQILINGELCPATQCVEISFSGGILVFNVTHFTRFASREAPSRPGSSDSSSSSGGGGGGGGGGGRGG